MTQREEFEKFWMKHCKENHLYCNLFRNSLDMYINTHAEYAFKGWKAAKAQAVPDVNTGISNVMPRGYMLNMLIKFQKWRIGEDDRTLDETGLTPRSITLAIDWAIEQLDKPAPNAVPKWIPVSEQMPEERSKAYQVAATCLKKYEGGNYDGQGKKTIIQDWVIRRWPQNFVSWIELPSSAEQNK